ncbi:glycosyltransferase family 2 protein [Pseudoalteromonas arctica]|uniref:Glycosyltransferase family 2 protein n=1 Tax=Pseudoalteromonas arctica TaxID=394751 RepID=A0ABU9THN9_9GAMM
MNISVVIPVYNKEKFVVDCIHSILHQSMLPKELIIINDGSTDNSLKVINDYISKQETEVKIKIISINNSGVSIARNKGVKVCSSEYVAFLDSDDVWEESYLYEMVSLITEFPECGMYSCNHMIKKLEIEKYVASNRLHYGESIIADFFKLSQSYSVVNSSKVIVKKDCFLDVGGFPPDIRYGEDLYVWIRLALISKTAFLNKPLVTINQFEDESRSSRVNDVLYPLLEIKRDLYFDNPELKKYLKILFRNSYLFRLQEGNKKTALKTILKSYRISLAYTFILLPFILLPSGVMKVLYKKYKQR